MEISVYVGYDRLQDPCYEVCKQSILNYNDKVNIQPIKLDNLIDSCLYYRETDPLASTEFIYSRFLTPYLNNYDGIAVYCDSDFLWQCDINEVLDYYDEKYAVMCVQHDYIPKSDTNSALNAASGTYTGYIAVNVVHVSILTDCNQLVVDQVALSTLIVVREALPKVLK